jgi:ABC-type polysaccharide/polyol phosphate transport system ATPase subunit
MQLVIQNLSKTYPGGVRALDNISMTIPTGMFGLLGPNGAGKSTLMRTLATLQNADSGSAMLGDLDVEVYYHPEHAWNVPRMSQAITAALEYCNQEFGPYRHKQARIIEFPRVAQFAQAFPGTMPYSESIGFIARYGTPEGTPLAQGRSQPGLHSLSQGKSCFVLSC